MPWCSVNTDESTALNELRWGDCGVDELLSSLAHRFGAGLKRHVHGGQRSQALVEFALVSPVFFLIMFTAIDISRLLYAYTAISSAARDGARTASLSGSTYSDCQIIQEVELVGQGFPV